MIVGVFSDIHGQLDALTKTLALFDQLQVDHIICAGDLVDRGPDGDKVVAIIRERDIPCVQGNHDAMAKRTQEFLARHQDAGLPIDPLSTDTVGFLSRLPVEQRFEWTGVSVYLGHANPWNDNAKYVYPTESRTLFESIVHVAQSQIIILGHTHRPMHIQMENSQIINPGSVFSNYGPYAQTCGILHLPQKSFELRDVQTGQPLPLAPQPPQLTVTL